MNLLFFDRSKYGKELLIDASMAQEIKDIRNAVSLTFYMICILKKSSGIYQLDNEQIELLEQQDGVLDSWEFEVVGGQNTEGPTVGMTVYENQEAFLKVAENILQDPITQAYFATFAPQAAQVSFSTTNN